MSEEHLCEALRRLLGLMKGYEELLAKQAENVADLMDSVNKVVEQDDEPSFTFRVIE